MFAIAFFGLALAGGLFAQEKQERQERHCPDQVVQRVETRVTPLMPQICGTNLNATFGGIQVTTPVNECPLVVVIRPGYDATVSSPGSGTYTIPVKTVPVTILQFECKGSWLLGILPIEVIQKTVPDKRRNTAIRLLVSLLAAPQSPESESSIGVECKRIVDRRL